MSDTALGALSRTSLRSQPKSFVIRRKRVSEPGEAAERSPGAGIATAAKPADAGHAANALNAARRWASLLVPDQSHTVQVSDPNDPAERQAERVADTVVRSLSTAPEAENAKKTAVPSGDELDEASRRRFEPYFRHGQPPTRASASYRKHPSLTEAAEYAEPGEGQERSAVRRAAEARASPASSGQAPYSASTSMIPKWADVAALRNAAGTQPDATAEVNAVRDAENFMHGAQIDRPFAASASDPKDSPGDAAGAGLPLARLLRRSLESYFGRDLSAVRLHTGTTADAAAQALSARAFTSGPRIAFARGEYAPETDAGRRLIAHEVSHVVQGRPGLHRQVVTRSPATLPDPITGTELPDYGWWAAGPDFSGLPTEEADIRSALISTGVLDQRTADACKVSTFAPTGGTPYFAYVHPTLGVVARGFGSQASHPPQPIYFNVYLYVANAVGSTLRPVGGSGSLRAPSQRSTATVGVVTASPSDVQANLRILRSRLAGMTTRYSTNDPVVGAAIVRAQAGVDTALGAAAPPAAAAVQDAVELLEAVDNDLRLIARQRATLVAEHTPTTSLEALSLRYADVLSHLLESDATSRYNIAQEWAERQPTDTFLDAVRAHGMLNRDVLDPAAVVVDWANDLRLKLDQYYTRRRAITPGAGGPLASLAAENDFLRDGVRGLQAYARYLVAFENFIRNRPGVLDTPLIDAMHRIRVRVDAIRTAYLAHDAAQLRALVNAYQGDPAVEEFLRALPAAMQVTQRIGRIAVVAAAALASGGVGGLVGGGTATGTTITFSLRSALTFAGTAALEAAVFTGVQAGASHILFGDRVTFGSLLKDFAWNVGLFGVLRGASGLSGAALRAAELGVLHGAVDLTSGFVLSHSYGVIQFRLERGRWPSSAEFDAMTADAVLLTAGVIVGSRVTTRWLTARRQGNALSDFQRDYGWRFRALDTIRSGIETDLQATEAAGRGSDPAELARIRTRSQSLEQGYQDVLTMLRADRRFGGRRLIDDMNALRPQIEDISAELLTSALMLPEETQLRWAASRSFTYATGKTTALRDALSAQGYVVRAFSDPASSLRTLTASATDRPTIVFQERSSGALTFDTGAFDVQSLLHEFSITDPDARRMVWRLLAQNGLTADPATLAGAITRTRKTIKAAAASDTSRPVQDALGDMRRQGQLYLGATPIRRAVVDRLASEGILRSPEWLDARDDPNRRGVIGEWLARETVAPLPGQRILRRLVVVGDLFEDAAATRPLLDSRRAPRVNVTVAETDLIYVHDQGALLAVDAILNVKASGGRENLRSAQDQNANFQAILATPAGGIAQVKISGTTRFARVSYISAMDGTTAINVTNQLQVTPTMTAETVAPQGRDAAGFTRQMTVDRATITELARLLAERQLVQAGDY
jgi:hypothetical protein